MGNAGIRMSVFPNLYKDGVVIPKEGFDTSNYNDVPLLFITGNSEFSLFTAFDPYFVNSVTDGSLFS
ncbi:carboxylesterase/lipase family protein, partial [Streptococcus suis]